MRVEPITQDDLPLIFEWWRQRGHGDMEADILPPVGFAAWDEEGPAAAAWLYQPLGCKVAFLDWFVTRPGMVATHSREAGRAVFEAISARADSDGATRLFASVGRFGMLLEAQACGFDVAADGMTHLVKLL